MSEKANSEEGKEKKDSKEESLEKDLFHTVPRFAFTLHSEIPLSDMYPGCVRDTFGDIPTPPPEYPGA